MVKTKLPLYFIHYRSDLVARNLQRSRDHGLPSYNTFRELCGLPKACAWNFPPSEIPASTWAELKKVYNHPDDIELFSGGLAETPFSGGVVGRTFNCLIARQFEALKMGDRFFFTHLGEAGSFDDDQLENIRERTLANVICDNTDIPRVAKNVFLSDSETDICLRLKGQLNVSLFLD